MRYLKNCARQRSSFFAITAAAVVTLPVISKAVSFNLSGIVDLNFDPGQDASGNWDGTISTSVTSDIFDLGQVVVPINSYPGQNLNWSSIGAWDNTALGVIDGVRLYPILVKAVEGATIPAYFGNANNGLKVLQSLGPTETGFSRDVYTVSVPSLNFTATLSTSVSLTYDVTIIAGSSIVMDQTPVVVHSLAVQPGGGVSCNSQFDCRNDAVNSGFASLAGVVEGNFTNNADGQNGNIGQASGLTVNGTFSNPGELKVGSLTLSSASTNSGYIILTGTLTSPGGFTNAGTLDQNSGSIVCSTGTITNQGTFNWSGGSVASMTNNANLNINIATPSASLTGTLDNEGYISHAGGSFVLGGIINNSGTYDLQSDSAGLSGSGTINNDGTILKSAGTGTTSITVAINNTATIEADSGTLDLGVSINNSGGALVANSAVLIIGGSVTNGGGTILASDSSAIVKLNGASVTGGTLNTAGGGAIQASGATIANLTNAGTLIAVGNLYIQGQINNSGIISLPAGSSAGMTSATFVGGGQVQLSSGSVTGDTLTNQDNTFSGFGSISANLINSGTLEAMGGTLSISGSINSNNGAILANGSGSIIQLNGGTVTGGILNTTGGGVILASRITINGATNAGTLTFTGSPGVGLEGQINNTGLLQSAPVSGGSVLYVVAGQTATLSGGGQILLDNGYINNTSTSVGVLINQDNLIHGSGYIWGNLVNNATVSADSSAQALVLYGLYGPTTNSGLFEAQSGGTLQISTSVANSAGTILASGAGSIVQLNGGGTIVGGTLTTSGGIVQAAGITISGITNAGTLSFTGIQGLNLQGQINNYGVIESGALSSNSNTLAVTSGQTATLTGGGQILLNSAISFINNTSNPTVGMLTNQNNLIHGYGMIFGNLINNATVSADWTSQTLTLNNDYGPTENTGTFEAQNGGILQISTSVNNSNGTILATGTGSTVQINAGGTITGGTFNTTGGGVIQASGATVSNAANIGTLTFSGSSGLSLQGQINNTGILLSAPVSAGSILFVATGQAAILSGGGQVVLDSTYSEINNTNTTVGVLTNQDNLIHGYGIIFGSLVNNGIISADSSGQTLIVRNDYGTTTNNGLVEAQNGGTLEIAAGALSNFVGTTLTGGSYEVDSNSVISLTGSIITNAANITLSGTGSTFAALASLSNNAGALNIGNVAFFSTAGSLSNTGSVTTAAMAGSAAGTLMINGALHQSAGQINDNGLLNVTGVVSITGGTLEVGPTGVLTGSPITVDVGGELLANGTLASAPAIADSGVVIFGATSKTGILTRTIASLAIGNGGSVAVAAAGSSSSRTLLVTSSLSIAGGTNAWTGQLDLANNDMDIAATSLVTVTNQIEQGYNNGNWNGSSGIMSTSAAADTTHLTALGVLQNNQSGYALFTSSQQFDGTTPSAGDILVKYTYYGDTNLSGTVDGSDYSRIDAAYLADLTHPGEFTGWYNGDFNYDGVIDGSDYTLIDNAFNTQGAGLTSEIANPITEITSAVFGGGTSVPEPTTVVILIPYLLGILGRRKVDCVRRRRERDAATVALV